MTNCSSSWKSPCLRWLRRGFTITELVIVMAVLAILAATVVPLAISGASIQAVAAGRLIATDLQQAQNEAIYGQSPVTVIFDPVGEAYTLSNASGVLIHPITNTAYIVDFSCDSKFDELDIVSADFGGAKSLTFDEMGAPDAGGVVVLQAGPHALEVHVDGVIGTVTVVEVGW